MVDKVIELAGDSKEAREQFLAVVRELNWGIVLCMGKEGEVAFELASKQVQDDYVHCSATYIKDGKALKPIIDELDGGDEVHWGEFGDRVLGIGPNDDVIVRLSRTEAVDGLKVWLATYLASGGEL